MLTVKDVGAIIAVLTMVAATIVLIVTMLRWRRSEPVQKEFLQRTDEQIVVNKEIARHLDRIATALEAYTK